MSVCERCHQAITDSADDVRMVEVIRDQAFGGEPGEVTEGRTVHFHREHVPVGNDRYLPAPDEPASGTP